MSKIQVIRGADSEIEFMGLYGMYVWGFFIGIAVSLLIGLLLFALLPYPSIAGVVTFGSIGSVVYFTRQWNKVYGRWGFEQKKIKDNLPSYVVMHRHCSLNRKNNG